jgi:hypothetical protein
VFAFADLDHMTVGADAGDLTSLVGCGESFTPDTRVATPSGERPIAALKVGDHVTAYDPATGKQTTQTVERVFLNHDTDRLDVTLTYLTPAPAGASADMAGHGRVARAGQRRQVAGTTTTTPATTATHEEVIHTTASHPWLTADAGWQRAGRLHLGEPVRLLDGATATVVALRTLPGVGAMWDLSLDATHTFAVGDAQAVVHNCDPVQVAKARAAANGSLQNSLQEPHTIKSMNKRGWTENEIVDTINNGTPTITADVTDGGPNNPQLAIRFTNSLGRAVTINASTGRIVQLGDAGFSYSVQDGIAISQGWRQ